MNLARTVLLLSTCIVLSSSALSEPPIIGPQETVKYVNDWYDMRGTRVPKPGEAVYDFYTRILGEQFLLSYVSIKEDGSKELSVLVMPSAAIRPFSDPEADHLLDVSGKLPWIPLFCEATWAACVELCRVLDSKTLKLDCKKTGRYSLLFWLPNDANIDDRHRLTRAVVNLSRVSGARKFKSLF